MPMDTQGALFYRTFEQTRAVALLPPWRLEDGRLPVDNARGDSYVIQPLLPQLNVFLE